MEKIIASAAAPLATVDRALHPSGIVPVIQNIGFFLIYFLIHFLFPNPKPIVFVCDA